MSKEFKENTRKYVLIGSTLVMIFLVTIFWLKVAFPISQKSDEGLPVGKEVNDENQLHEKIDNAISLYSCEAKKEEILKGYIEKIESDYVIVANGTEQVKVLLKPETVFTRITVYADGKSSLAEIKKTDLKIGQDVVSSIFQGDDNLYYSLFIKQINLVI